MNNHESPDNGGEAERDERVIISFEEHAKRAEAPAEDVEPGELTGDEVKCIVEAILFAAGEPLSPAVLARLSGARDARAVRAIVEDLRGEYARQHRAFTIEEVAGGYQMMSLPEFHTWISKLHEKERDDTLSQAALETLAIVAYKQPVTRAQIEDIRGVQSGYILRSLIEKGLARVTGRSDQLGHPLLYGTSKKFLEAFGLASLETLPTLAELQPPAAHRQGAGDEPQQ